MEQVSFPRSCQSLSCCHSAIPAVAQRGRGVRPPRGSS